MYVKYIMCMLGAHEGQKGELDNSKLGARNQMQVLCKSNKHFITEPSLQFRVPYFGFSPLSNV